MRKKLLNAIGWFLYDIFGPCNKAVSSILYNPVCFITIQHEKISKTYFITCFSDNVCYNNKV